MLSWNKRKTMTMMDQLGLHPPSHKHQCDRTEWCGTT